MTKLAYLAPLALLAALLCVPESPAGCRRVTAYRRAAVVHEHVFVTPVVAATFLQVPVATYPVYGVGAGPNYGGDVAAEIRALRLSLERLSTPAPELSPAPRTAPPATMPREQAGPAASPAAASPASAAPKVIAASCARCHGATNPKGGLTLTGDVPQLVKLKALRAVITGKMPPDGAAVADDDLEALAKWSE